MNASLITLAQATNYFPKRGGKKVHIKTIKRRIVKGVGGVRLAAVKDGGVWYTTPEWIREFQLACTKRALQGSPVELIGRKMAHRMATENLRRRYGFDVTNCQEDQQALCQ